MQWIWKRLTECKSVWMHNWTEIKWQWMYLLGLQNWALNRKNTFSKPIIIWNLNYQDSWIQLCGQFTNSTRIVPIATLGHFSSGNNILWFPQKNISAAFAKQCLTMIYFKKSDMKNKNWEDIWNSHYSSMGQKQT